MYYLVDELSEIRFQFPVIVNIQQPGFSQTVGILVDELQPGSSVLVLLRQKDAYIWKAIGTWF